MKLRDIQIRTGLFATSLLSMLWGYHVLFLRHAPDIFTNPAEDMSYGWYIPAFSLFVLWRERHEILASLGAPSAWAAAWLVPCAFVGFLGVRGAQVRLEIVGFVGLLLALVWTFYGAKAARRTAFPVLFLLFCLPLHTYLDLVTIHLRLLAVAIAHAVLLGCGLDVMREGTMLASASGSFAIDVAEPCSGLRSLFAMMALTAGYAYFTQETWLRRAVLFALSIPIAIAGNVLRIFSIALVATTCAPDFATGFYHDYSGYVVFLAAIVLMVATGELISRGAKRWARR